MNDGNFSKLTSEGERKNIEFKENLNSETHLLTERKQQLASQMKYRLEKGNGEAIYFLGVDDDGHLLGLEKRKMDETIHVLSELASEISAKIIDITTEQAPKSVKGSHAFAKCNRSPPHGVGPCDHGKAFGGNITMDP